MATLRMGRGGKLRSYGIASRPAISRAERILVRNLDKVVQESTPKSSTIRTWGHWAGCEGSVGDPRFTTNGKVASRLVKAQKIKEDQ